MSIHSAFSSIFKYFDGRVCVFYFTHVQNHFVLDLRVFRHIVFNREIKFILRAKSESFQIGVLLFELLCVFFEEFGMVFFDTLYGWTIHELTRKLVELHAHFKGDVVWEGLVDFSHGCVKFRLLLKEWFKQVFDPNLSTEHP